VANFSVSRSFATAKQWLVDTVHAVQLPDPVAVGATTASDDDDDASEPAAKRQRVDDETESPLHLSDELLDSDTSTATGQQTAEEEVSMYLQKSNIPSTTGV